MAVLLDMSSAPVLTEKFIFIGSDKLEAYLDVRKTQRFELKKALPEGLYWFQLGRKIFWNWHLIRNLLLNGSDRNAPAHQKLVEEFLATLPTTA